MGGEVAVPREPLVDGLVVATGPTQTAQLAPLPGQLVAQPVADLGPEGEVGVGVAEVHECYPTKHLLG